MWAPCHFRSPSMANSSVSCIVFGARQQRLPSCIDTQKFHSSVLCCSFAGVHTLPFCVSHQSSSSTSWPVQPRSASGSPQSQQACWFGISSHSCQLVFWAEGGVTLWGLLFLFTSVKASLSLTAVDIRMMLLLQWNAKLNFLE